MAKLQVRANLRAFLILMLVLTGCAGKQGLFLADFHDWEMRKRVLQETDEWEFSGRIGVSAGNEGFNGKLWWRQDGTVFRARISGPLGVGTIFINGNKRELTLTERDGEVTELEDAEVDLRARYGWTIPVTSLRYWALGVPDPNLPSSEEFDANGLLSALTQRKWDVAITEYRDGGGQPMPRRLTAVDDDIKVRLIIDSWAFR